MSAPCSLGVTAEAKRKRVFVSYAKEKSKDPQTIRKRSIIFEESRSLYELEYQLYFLLAKVFQFGFCSVQCKEGLARQKTPGRANVYSYCGH